VWDLVALAELHSNAYFRLYLVVNLWKTSTNSEMCLHEEFQFHDDQLPPSEDALFATSFVHFHVF